MSKLCFGCMQHKAHSPVCEHCGFDETSANLPHQLPIGTLLQNQYLVGRVLGQGGFGITYIGWDQHLSVPVAIKEYFPAGIVHRHTKLGTGVLCETGETENIFGKHRERFLKEARTLAKLSDIPEIVQIKNYFLENGTAYIVMEYVQGITLKAYLKQLGRPMTEAETLEIVEPVLRALQKVHDQQLIHRDISPDNIMLPSSGGVKLIDFGTVRYMDASGASKSTETVLKPGFAPMEQYNTRGNLGTWTDVYALSATFYYLLTGKVPPDVHQRMEDGEELTRLRNVHGLSQHIVHTLEQGMRLRAADRIQTVEALYRQLYYGEELLSEDLRQETAAPEPELPQPEATPRPLWKRLVPGVAAAAVLIAAAGFLLPKEKEAPVQSVTPPAAVTEASTEPSGPDDAQAAEIRYSYGLSLLDAQMYEQAAEVFAELDTYQDSRLAYHYALGAWQEASRNYGPSAISYGKAVGFRDALDRCYKLWSTLPGRQTVSLDYGENNETLIHAIRTDGTLLTDAQNGTKTINTDHYRDLVSISGSIGLRRDGTLVLPDAQETGIRKTSLNKINQYRKTLLEWTDIIMLSVDEDYNAVIGVKADGSVVAVGSGDHEKCQAVRWENIILVSQGSDWVVGLRADGTVTALGNNDMHQCDVENWRNIIDISTGDRTTVGLTPNGTVVATGFNASYVVPPNLDWVNIAELEDGPFALLANGKAVAGFHDWESPRTQVGSWTSIVGLDGNASATVGLRSDGTLVFTQPDTDTFPKARTWSHILQP